MFAHNKRLQIAHTASDTNSDPMTGAELGMDESSPRDR